MHSFRFSPILNKGALLTAVEHITNTAVALSERVVGRSYPITSVSVFAHFEEESAYLEKLIYTLGTKVGDTNGPRIRLTKPLTIGRNTISYIRIRRPDFAHPQVGCVDFEVPSYATFAQTHLSKHGAQLKRILRPTYELIEMSDPQYDVTGYILSEPERSYH